jgi:hypothetical protein
LRQKQARKIYQKTFENFRKYSNLSQPPAFLIDLAQVLRGDEGRDGGTEERIMRIIRKIWYQIAEEQDIWILG